ncbi:hypothetical protein [Specibacter sp. RAF43]|uniref:hypothetical protein n=1 Tax=Specibacter sp. RAF43 TaxID=3233057 RepID=UPI003F9E4C03
MQEALHERRVSAVVSNRLWSISFHKGASAIGIWPVISAPLAHGPAMPAVDHLDDEELLHQLGGGLLAELA